MAGWRDLGNIWSTFKEIDVRPIREQAEEPLVLAFIGAHGVGKSTLVSALQHDARSNERVISPTLESGLTDPGAGEDLVVLVLDATRSELGYQTEAELFRQFKSQARRVVVFYNKMDLVGDRNSLANTVAQWGNAPVAFGSALSIESLERDFLPRVMGAVPEKDLSLARHYPIFRIPVARDLIGDTSFANATYALGAGLAEVIPALDIPFNVADMVVLTKNQALMVYKLGLALGLSPRWQDHFTELGSVIGAGFFWRQIARQLVGLIPVWGILPQVAVAYAGTYVIGEAVIYWYKTGHKMPKQGMRQLYADALKNGRLVAQNLLKRTPRASLPRIGVPALARPHPSNTCAHCGRKNPRDATFCAYCGESLGAQEVKAQSS